MAGLLIFWFGLLLGSFLNVCIYRLQRGESLVLPRSRCPRCGRSIFWYDNVPVLSYLWLRGRCRHCRSRISLRYPFVEVLSAALLFGLWRRWEGLLMWPAAAYAASAILLVIAFIDWDTFLIPDVLSFSLIGLGVLSAPWNPYFPGSIPWRLAGSLIGAAAGFAICFAVALLGERIFKKEAMGGGDVKLLAAVGAWSGVLGAFDCLMIASLLGALYGVPLLLKGKIKKQEPIPFGPFLSAAAVFNFFYLIPFGFPF